MAKMPFLYVAICKSTRVQHHPTSASHKYEKKMKWSIKSMKSNQKPTGERSNKYQRKRRDELQGLACHCCLDRSLD